MEIDINENPVHWEFMLTRAGDDGKQVILAQQAPGGDLELTEFCTEESLQEMLDNCGQSFDPVRGWVSLVRQIYRLRKAQDRSH